jgi:hypothetical protein
VRDPDLARDSGAAVLSGAREKPGRASEQGGRSPIRKARQEIMGGEEMIMKPGTMIPVRFVGNGIDKTYMSIVSGSGTQRFPGNEVIQHLFDERKIDLNNLAMIFRTTKTFSQEQFLDFYILGLGYSVDGIRSLSLFEDLEIFDLTPINNVRPELSDLLWFES